VHISLLPILFKCLSPLSSLSFILRLVRRQNSLCVIPPNFVLKELHVVLEEIMKFLL
jgi:type III secretory pathway component EscR